MASERQLFLNSEDAHTCASVLFDAGISGKNKCRFGEVHLTGDRLHLVIAEAGAIVNHSEWITFQGARCEHVELGEGKRAGEWCHVSWIEEAAIRVQELPTSCGKPQTHPYPFDA